MERFLNETFAAKSNRRVFKCSAWDEHAAFGNCIRYRAWG